MKYIVYIFLVLGMCCMTTTAAMAETEIVWKRGDTLMAMAVCKSEEAIMKIAQADTKSKEETISEMQRLAMFQQCIRVIPPALFKIHSILGSYLDYAKNTTTIIALCVPPSEQNIIAYAIAQGRPATEKEQSY